MIDEVDGVRVDDLSSLIDPVTAEAVMEVKNAVGEVMRHDDGRAFTITLLSKDNAAYRDLSRKMIDRRMEQYSRTRSVMLGSATERDNIELLVAITKGWDIILNGKKPESTPAKYREAYTMIPALREQVEEFTGVRANFSKS